MSHPHFCHMSDIEFKKSLSFPPILPHVTHTRCLLCIYTSISPRPFYIYLSHRSALVCFFLWQPRATRVQAVRGVFLYFRALTQPHPFPICHTHTPQACLYLALVLPEDFPFLVFCSFFPPRTSRPTGLAPDDARSRRRAMETLLRCVFSKKVASPPPFVSKSGVSSTFCLNKWRLLHLLSPLRRSSRP